MSTSVGSYLVSGGPGQPSAVHEAIVVKIYTSATTWIVVDGIGGFATGFNPIAQAGGERSPTGQATSIACRPGPAGLRQAR